MKLAILISGFHRPCDGVREMLDLNLASHYDTSIFVSTWDIANSRKVEQGTGIIDDTAGTCMKDVASWWGPKVADITMRDYDLYMKTTLPITPIDRQPDLFTSNQRANWHGIKYMNRIRDQWWCVRDGLRLIEDYEQRVGVQFDLICRTRSDVWLDAQLPQWSIDRVLFGKGLMMTMQGWDACELLPDYFFIGPRNYMMRFKDLSASVEKLYNRQFRDTTNAESTITDFVIQQDIPIDVKDLSARIVW